MTKIKLIASDMDHTLLTENGQLPPKMDEYLDRLNAAGITFAAASGRPLVTLEDMFTKHKDQMLLICNNGAVVKYKGDVIAENILPHEDLMAMYNFAINNTDAHPLIAALEGAVIRAVDRQYDAHYRAFYKEINYVDDIQQWAGESDKLSLFFPMGDAEKVFNEQINPRYGEHYSIAVADVHWIDIMPKHVNKGTAMAKVSEITGIPADQMMAFGDTFNDAEMLQFVGHSYLVANANPKMAEFANLRTGSNEEYGVLQVLDKVLAEVE